MTGGRNPLSGRDDDAVGARRDETLGSPPHGFSLDAGDEALLRGPVPAEALDWVARTCGHRVRATRALEGGTSSAVHAIALDGGAELVLRRFVRLDWLADEPDLAVREARALESLAGGPVPAPRLVAVDPDGSEAGAPAVLMTRLEGEIDWRPREVEPYLRALAEALPAIHEARADVALPPYRPYAVAMHRPPAWARAPEAWLRAIEVLEGPQPSAERRFIHRDYHPGNVLWQDGRVSGIVDWVNASIGSPWADVGHCRVNIASELGSAAADRFLAHYRTAAGRDDDYAPYWDLVAAVGGLDETVDEHPEPADEAFIAAAVARL